MVDLLNTLDYAGVRLSSDRRGRQHGFSHLHVVVPAEAHNYAKAVAAKSGMPFKLYMAKLLMTAEPISDLSEAPKEPSTNAAEGIAQQE